MRKKNILIYAVVFFMIFAIEFGLNSFLSFYLLEKQYLFYQNIINILPLFTIFLGFGTPFAILYLGSLSEKKLNIYAVESNLFTLYFSLLIACIIYLLYIFNYLKLYIPIALVLGFFNVIKQNSVNFYLSKKELNKSSFIRLNQKIIYFIVIVLSIYVFTNIDDADLSSILIVGEFLGFTILIYKYKLLSFKKFTKIKSIIKISKYAFMANLFSMISLASPIIFLNYFHYPVNEIISFSIAYTLLKYSGVLLGPFMQLITPYFTPIKTDYKKVFDLYKKYVLLLFFIGVIISFIMHYLSGYIINIFFNAKYSQSIKLFDILLFSIPFLFINSFSMSMISSIVSIKLTAKIVFWTMLLSLISLFYFTIQNCKTDIIGILILDINIFISILSVIVLSSILLIRIRKC